MISPTAQPARRQGGETGARQHERAGADDAGDADTRREELEHKEGEPDEEEQVGDRRAGDRVEQAVDERQARLPHGGDRRSPHGAVVVEHLVLGRLQHAAALGIAVEGVDHARQCRDPFIGDPLTQHSEVSGVAESDRVRSQPGGGVAEVDVDTGRAEQFAGMTDPRTRGHPRDVGDGEELSRRAVQPGARWPDPDGDRHRRCGDGAEQLLHPLVADHRAAAVDLNDQRLGVGSHGVVDGALDGLDDEAVEQPADEKHVDTAEIGGGDCICSAVALALASAGTGRTCEQAEPHRGDQQADR